MYNELVCFIRELYCEPNAFIPLHAPVFGGNEKKYLNECIDTTFVSSVGKFVDQFEEQMANYTGAKRAIACVNGTAALHIALILSGAKQRDEVITQPLTFIATANAISYIGALPVFVDVDKDTLGLSPVSLISFLEEYGDIHDDGFCYNKKTGNRIIACLPVHTFGHPCKIDEIADICDHYKIKLIEDAAESIGSTFKGRHTGTFGIFGVISFNGNKTITTGGGGMILTNDEEHGNLAKHITTQAKVPHKWEFYHDQTGYNYRMPNINAAIGVAQLEQIEKMISKKRQIAESYFAFSENKGLNFFSEPQHARSNYWLNVLFMKDRAERDAFLKYMNEKGIMVRPSWTLMNKLPMFENCFKTDISNAEWIEERLVNIPSSSKI